MNKFVWAEMLHGENGHVPHLKCVCCSFAKVKDVLFIPKSDNLKKHASKRKTTKDMTTIKMKKVEWYVHKHHVHVKDEKAYASSSHFSILKQVHLPSNTLSWFLIFIVLYWSLV